MKLLFLDIDGVLNNHHWCDKVLCGQIHKDKIELINLICNETNCKIIISSAWRYIIFRGEMNLKGFEWLLRSHGLHAGLLYGYTREDTMMPKEFNGDIKSWPLENERGKQITDWRRLNNHQDNYVVIDDLDLGISKEGHPFVKTDGIIGLTKLEAICTINLLGIK